MAIVQTPQYWIKKIAVIGVVAILAACGGGGGGSNSGSGSSSSNGSGSGSVTPPPVEVDITPDSFAFEAKNDAMPGEIYTSNAITVSGINAAAPVSITGGEYAIDNGNFTSAAATVSAGQTIVVRATAASTLDSIVDVVLTIGGVKGTYSIITPVDETAPTAEFMFPPPVSMTDGESIRVRGVTSDDYSKILNVKINGEEVKPTGDNFATWEADVPLDPGNNLLVVETTDAVGNTSTNAAEVRVHRGAITKAFPDEANQFNGVVGFVIDRLDDRNRLITIGGDTPEVINVDLSTGERTYFINSQPFGPGNSIWDVALDKQGKEVYFRSYSTILAQPLDGGASREMSTTKLSGGMVLTLDNIDKDLKVVMVGSDGGINIIVTNSAFSEFTKLSPTAEDPENLLGWSSYGLTLDRVNGRYLITDAVNQNIVAVDRTTGIQSIFSSNDDVGNGDSFADKEVAFIGGIAVDEENLRAIVAEIGSGKLFSIDLTTGDRTLISSPEIPNANVAMEYIYDIKINTPASYAFVADNGLKAVVAVDLVTGHRVVFSKSVTAAP